MLIVHRVERVAGSQRTDRGAQKYCISFSDPLGVAIRLSSLRLLRKTVRERRTRMHVITAGDGGSRPVSGLSS